MDTSVMFLDCPAYMDSCGAARCGLPAAVEYRYTMRSTDGPLESVKIRCPRGHCFNGPVESMLWKKTPDPARPSHVPGPGEAICPVRPRGAARHAAGGAGGDRSVRPGPNDRTWNDDLRSTITDGPGSHTAISCRCGVARHG